jgi:hypothetical protein
VTSAADSTDVDTLLHLRRRLRAATLLAVMGLVLGPVSGVATALMLNTPGPRGDVGPLGLPGPSGPAGVAGQDGVTVHDPALQAMVRDYAASAAAAASQNCFPVTVVTSVSFYSGAF